MSLETLEEEAGREKEYVGSPTEPNYYAWQLVLRELSLYRIEQTKIYVALCSESV